MANNEQVSCPLVEYDMIEDIECIETRDVVNGVLKETAIGKKLTVKSNWKEICKKCKYHNY